MWQVAIVKNGKTARQVHGSTIISADGSGPADGIFITNPNNEVGIKTADCMPLVLLGEGSALALHVSRKTLVAGILDQVPKYIQPNEIKKIYIGPHICAEHFTFEWEGQGIANFRRQFPQAVTKKDGVLHLSLLKAVRQYFNSWGIAPTMEEDGRCTFEDQGLPSYKRWLLQGKPGELEQLITLVS